MALVDAIEGLDPSHIGSSPGRLADAITALGRLEAAVVEAVGVFDANGLWALDNATSAAAWLRGHTGMAHRTGASLVRQARALRSCPVTAAAVRDGRLTGDQTRAILAYVDAPLAPVWQAQEAALVPVLATLQVRDIHASMAHWRSRARTDLDESPPLEEHRSLHLSELPDGWRLDATLTPEGGEIVRKALAAATTADADGEPVRTAAQRRADALVDLCRRALDRPHTTATAKRVRPHLDLACSLTDLRTDGPAHTAAGTLIDATTLQRLACDATISRLVVRGRSHLLDYGHTTRVVPTPVFRALVRRDRHCRWPGCDRPPEWCEAHHLVHWLRGGPTEPDNLALFCTRHHHVLHTPGWTTKLDPHDATIRFTTPDGRILESKPPPIHTGTTLFDSS
jgi:hypothetical protein